MILDIGKKIKELRAKKELTLKELSEKTGLSIGYLSQLERGMTTISIDLLEKIAQIFDTDLSYFFNFSSKNNGSIIKSYEQEVFRVENSQFIYYHLTNHAENKTMLPRLVQILPGNNEEEVICYQHEGEEFIYILEGILTLYIDNERHDMYPGDSAHISSTIGHNWANYTNKTVKLLAINTPNSFNDMIER